MTKYEIGLVYEKDGHYWIATSETVLVNGEGGDITELRPSTKYDLVRSISVEELCEAWSLSLEQFDGLMSSYLAPSAAEVKSRPRGTRRPKSDDDEFWRRHRTGRIDRTTL
ncbi:MAG: hypothetical protein AB7L09_00430 [Nitrospira sp.]